MQEFTLSTHLCFGEHALDCLKTLEGQRFLLVSDPFFAKNGTAQRICSLCPGETKIFSQVKPDPPLELVAQGVALLEDFSPDVLLALGGGSAMDCAKGMLSMSGRPLYFVAIPTTSGTGSEVTSFAILTHEGIKHPLVGPELRPQLAILDPALLEQLPPSLIAEAGMDTVAHCVEALGAKNASPFTQALACSAYQTVLTLLPRSFEGDLSVRSALHCAATMAGIAFDNAGLGACHALSHALGGLFHLPHGLLNGILLPHVMDFNRNQVPYSLLGGNPFFSITRLRRRLGLPPTLREAGLSREEVMSKTEVICEAAMKDPCAAGNPRPLTVKDFSGILRASL